MVHCFLNHIRVCACTPRARFSGTSNRGHLFVETATVATKGFRDPKRVKHAWTSLSDFEKKTADARMLEQRYAMYAPKIIRGGGGAGDGGDCIDTGSVKHRGSKRASTFQEVFIAFMKRSSRILVDNPTDGHCGIHCLQEFLRPFSAMPSYCVLKIK